MKRKRPVVRRLSIEEMYQMSASRFEIIIPGFDGVNELLERQLEKYTFDEMLIVARFYIRSSNTNILIYQASKLAQTDAMLLEKYNNELREQIERYKVIDKTRFLQMDFQTPVNDRLMELMTEERRTAIEAGTHLQEVYIPMKDKLASLDPTTNDYQILYEEFQGEEAKQKFLSDTATDARHASEHEQTYYGMICLFKPILLDILVQKLESISQKITIDLRNAEEVGDE